MDNLSVSGVPYNRPLCIFQPSCTTHSTWLDWNCDKFAPTILFKEYALLLFNLFSLFCRYSRQECLSSCWNFLTIFSFQLLSLGIYSSQHSVDHGGPWLARVMLLSSTFLRHFCILHFCNNVINRCIWQCCWILLGLQIFDLF
jgi:hypothetical protein